MDLDQILPHVYVGGCPTARGDIERLKDDFRVTAVLNVQTEDDFPFWGVNWDKMEEYYRQSGIDVRWIPVRDFDPAALRRKLPACVEELEELLNGGHTVYVHCSAGINRSPSVVISYLHWVQEWELDKAMEHVASHRSCKPYLEAIRLATEDRLKDSDFP